MSQGGGWVLMLAIVVFGGISRNRLFKSWRLNFDGTQLFDAILNIETYSMDLILAVLKPAPNFNFMQIFLTLAHMVCMTNSKYCYCIGYKTVKELLINIVSFIKPLSHISNQYSLLTSTWAKM